MSATTTRGLGRGLSALMTESYSQSMDETATPSTTSHSPIGLMLASIRPSQFQPRTEFNDEALKELSESIKQHGVMQPVLVRPSKEEGMYELIAGERRWRASKMAGLVEIPAIIREFSDKETLEVALIENIQREDLSPLEEARGYQRLIAEFKYTQEKLSKVVGKSRSHVANLMRLLSLPEPVQAMLDEGKLAMGHARALLSAENPEAMAKEIADTGMNVRQTEEAVRPGPAMERKRAGSAPKMESRHLSSRDKDPDILALEESLSENIGVRVSIHDRGNTGEIVLGYDSLKQLDDILRRLGGGM